MRERRLARINKGKSPHEVAASLGESITAPGDCDPLATGRTLVTYGGAKTYVDNYGGIVSVENDERILELMRSRNYRELTDEERIELVERSALDILRDGRRPGARVQAARMLGELAGAFKQVHIEIGRDEAMRTMEQAAMRAQGAVREAEWSPVTTEPAQTEPGCPEPKQLPNAE